MFLHHVVFYRLLIRMEMLRPSGSMGPCILLTTVRGEVRPESDFDVLVEFQNPVGIFEFLRLRHRLEKLLGRRVDLVTPAALKRQLRDQILKEAVYAG